MKESLLRSLKKIRGLFEDEKTLKYCDYLEGKVSSLEEETYEAEISFPRPRELEGKNDYALFSDGACRGNPGPGSWGVLAQNFNGELIFEASSFDQETTNNKMELMGALQSLKLFKDFLKDEEDSFSDIRVFLYTDSNYVVQGLNNWRHNWKKKDWKKSDNKPVENKPLWVKLDKATEGFKSFKAIWVKGHNNHPQNERCDELCNEILDRELS